MKENNKGITLVSLVITILVLLILASVATYSGKSTIEYAKFNSAKSQFEMLQSKVNYWYQEYKGLEDSEKTEWLNNYGLSINNCDESIANLSISSAGKSENYDNYRYFSADYLKNNLDLDGMSYDFLVDFSTRSVLLFGGIEYDGKTYYSAEDFGINNVIEK